MRVNWTERLEARRRKLTTHPHHLLRMPAEGRGGRQGKHAAHRNAERPPPRAVAKTKKGGRGGGPEAAKGLPEPPGEGRAVEVRGGGQREEQTPVTRHEYVGWVMANDPSSISFPSSRPWICGGERDVEKNGTLQHVKNFKIKHTYKHSDPTNTQNKPEAQNIQIDD